MQKISGILVLITMYLSLSGQSPTDSIAYAITLSDQVVTAQYEPTHYKQALHQVDVIKKETMTRRGVVTLEQALTISPALRLYQDPVLGTSIAMRGVSASNVAILIDGVPVIGRQNGAIDLSQISMQNVERIEIVQGPLSNIYGSNAAGGVINIITKKSQINTLSGQLGTQLESIGQQNHQGNIGYKIGRLTANAHGRYFHYNQYPQDSLRIIDKITLSDGNIITRSRYPFNPKMQSGIGGFLRYDITDESHLMLKYDRNKEDVTDYGVIKRIQFKPYANDQFYHTDRSDVSLFYKSKWNKLYLDATLAANDYKRMTDDKRYYIETKAFDSILQSTDTISFNTYFGKMNLTYNATKLFSINGGMAFTQENGSGDRIKVEGADSKNASFTEVAPYLDARYSVTEHLKTMFSLRYTIHSAYKDKITPAFQLKYDINAKWNARLGYAQGYRSPSLKELYLVFIDINHYITGNVNLRPETSHDMQASVSFTPRQNLELMLNAYHTTIKDRINLTEYDALKFKYENIDNYTVYGFQPTLKYNWLKWTLQSSGSIGYWATNINEETTPKYGKVIDYNNSLSYEYSRYGIVFSANHRHTGNQPTYRLINDEVQVSTIQGYDIIDASVSKSFINNRLSVNAGVRNLGGITNTAITGTTATGVHSSDGRNIVSQGRSYFVNINYNF
jgi:outer membrane receptor for ferrienterochelin and colicins